MQLRLPTAHLDESSTTRRDTPANVINLIEQLLLKHDALEYDIDWPPDYYSQASDCCAVNIQFMVD